MSNQIITILHVRTDEYQRAEHVFRAQGVRLCGGADGRRQLTVRRDKDGGHVRQHTRGGAGGAGAARPGGGGGGGEGGQNTPASELLDT